MRTPMAVRLANAVKSLSSSRRRKSASTHNRVAARVDVLENRQLLAGVFTQLTNPIPNGASGTMMLLTDGTVMVRGVETPRLQPFGNLNLNGIGLSNEWHKLTPDNLGNYLNGTWSPMASMNNERLGAGSVVLPSGKVFVVGGEWSGVVPDPALEADPQLVQTSTGRSEIYDPVTDTWTETAPFPKDPIRGFGSPVGPTVLLKNGLVMSGFTWTSGTYLYDPASDTWGATDSKFFSSDEETWITLPDGSVLAYSSWGTTFADRYNPTTGVWTSTGPVPVSLLGPGPDNKIGVGTLLPNGNAILLGGNGKSAIYRPSSNTWITGPSLPGGIGSTDSPGVMLPNGKFLFMAGSIAAPQGPSKLYEYSYVTNTFTDVTSSAPAGLFANPQDMGHMLMLPNGHVLFNIGAEVWDYTPQAIVGNPQAGWAPTMTGILQVGSSDTFILSGTRLTGISEGAIYGDDEGVATNYPIVRLQNSLGVIKYARTTNWTPGVAQGNSTVQFKMPAGFPVTGTYQITVIANGIPSIPTVLQPTALLVDIFSSPKASSSNPKNLTDVNGTVFFTATDGLKGTELWKTDGTSVGTVLVKDIRAGSAGSDPANLINVNGTLYFTANDAVKGLELWKSDGTAAGTVVVKDIKLGVGSSNPIQLTNVNGTLYFQATDGVKGLELWKSDGTAAGTVMVKDITAGLLGSSPTNLISFNNTLFFVASNGVNGAELWKSDGTLAGTTLVKDIRVGIDSSTPTNFTPMGSTLFFTANSGTTGLELWKTDGTTAGTTLVKDIETKVNVGSNPKFLTVLNGILYFQATTVLHGVELWKSNGTAAGTTLVGDLTPGAAGSAPSNLFAFNNSLYFQAFDPVRGNELWKSNGTGAGTFLFKDINPIALNGSYPSQFIKVGTKMYFTANDGTSGYELWESDGTAVGTIRSRDINFGSESSTPSSLIVSNGKLFFSANNSTNGFELWMI